MTNSFKGKPFEGPSKAAILRSKKDKWIDIITPYSRDFVDNLKETVQPGHRKWDPDNKIWTVSEIYLEQVANLLKQYFDEVETDLLEPMAQPENIFVPILSLIRDEDLDRVYKLLCFAVHPDRGGNEESMKLLNIAYSERKNTKC